ATLTPTTVTAAQSATTGTTVTNADVIKLVRAGLGEALIIQTIDQAAEAKFDTSPDALIQLKMAGVSDAVISAMVTAKSKAAAPSTAAIPSPNRAPVRAFKD